MTKKRQNGNEQPLRSTCDGKLCKMDEFEGKLYEKDDQTFVLDNFEYKKIPSEGFRIDINSIPDYVLDDLATSTLEFIREVMKDPENRRKIEARTRTRKEAQHT